MTFPHIDICPDFSRFKDTLLLRRAWRRPPLFDFHIAHEHKTKMLGYEPQTMADQVRFYRHAGYDYVQFTIAAVPDELHAAKQAQRDQAGGTISHGSEQGLIDSLEHYRSRRWSWQGLSEGDMSFRASQFDDLERLAEVMPQDMRIVFNCSDIFTMAWEMIGFSPLCIASFEQPEFIAEVMQSFADANLNIVKHAIARAGDRIGALLFSDDIAYTEGLMLGPEFFREHLFGHIKKLVDEMARIDAPTIYHSDGRLYPVFDDLAAMGICAIQPLEPKSMDPMEIKQRWPGQFCLLGNIDLDLMARGEPDAVEREVRAKIDRLNATGGYMPGISNTVPHYVKHENYVRLIQTVYSYPDEPVQVPSFASTP